MGGLLEDVLGGGGETPKPVNVGLDQGTTEGIQGSYDRASQTPQQFADKRMEGVSDAAHSTLTSLADKMTQEKALGSEGGSAALSAINGRYAGLMDKHLDKMKNEAMVQGNQDKMLAAKQAQVHLQAQQNVANEAYQRQMEAYKAEQAARGGVLKSVLGIAGTVVGTIYGGPAGGAIGGKIGTAVADNNKGGQ